MNNNFQNQVMFTDRIYPSTHQQDQQLQMPYGIILQPFKHKNKLYQQSNITKCNNCKNFINIYCKVTKQNEMICSFCNSLTVLNKVVNIEENIYTIQYEQIKNETTIQNIYFCIDLNDYEYRKSFVQIVKTLKYQFDLLLHQTQQLSSNVVLNIVFIFINEQAHILQLSQCLNNVNSQKFEFKQIKSNIVTCDINQQVITNDDYVTLQQYYSIILRESVMQQISIQEKFNQQQINSILYNQQLFNLLFILCSQNEEMDGLFIDLEKLCVIQNPDDQNQKMNRNLFQACMMLEQFNSILQTNKQLNQKYNQVYSYNMVISFGGDSQIDASRNNSRCNSEQELLQCLYPDQLYDQYVQQVRKYQNTFINKPIFYIFFNNNEFVDLVTYSLFTENNQGTLQTYEKGNQKFYYDLVSQICYLLTSLQDICIMIHSDKYQFYINQFAELDNTQIKDNDFDWQQNYNNKQIKYNHADQLTKWLNNQQSTIKPKQQYQKQTFVTQCANRNFKIPINMIVNNQDSKQNNEYIQIIIMYKSLITRKTQIQVQTFLINTTNQLSEVLYQQIPLNKALLCLINYSNLSLPTKISNTKNITYENGFMKQKKEFYLKLQQYSKQFLKQFNDVNNVNFSLLLKYSYNIFNSVLFKDMEKIFIDDKIFSIFKIKQFNQDNILTLINILDPQILVCPLNTTQPTYYEGIPDINILNKSSEFAKMHKIQKNSCCILLNNLCTHIICIFDETTIKTKQSNSIQDSFEVDIQAQQYEQQIVGQFVEDSLTINRNSLCSYNSIQKNLVHPENLLIEDNYMYVDDNEDQQNARNTAYCKALSHLILLDKSNSDNIFKLENDNQECSNSNVSNIKTQLCKNNNTNSLIKNQLQSLENSSSSWQVTNCSQNSSNCLIQLLRTRILEQSSVAKAILYFKTLFKVDDDSIIILSTCRQEDKALIDEHMHSLQMDQFILQLLQSNQ